LEAVLAGHPAVREAVVVARDDLAGGRALVAYAVPRPGVDRVAGELRSFLRSKLPASMVPAWFVLLPALPRTLNGKVDRRALPRPPQRAEPEAAPPQTPVEEMVAGIWEDLLGVDRIGRSDNLFELGAHSLLAMQFVSRLRRVLGFELPLRQLFQEPTVRGLAVLVQAALAAPPEAATPPLVAGPRSAPIPLSFAQERLWFLDRLEPGAATYTMPAAFDLHGPLRCEVAAAALTEVARRHEALRTTFGIEGGTPSQRVGPPQAVALPEIDLGALAEEAGRRESARLGVSLAHRAFDLERGPLFAAVLLRLDRDHHRLLFNVHHIASDGWSFGILAREVSTIYEAFAAGLRSPLPELPIQVPDFAAWQRRQVAGHAGELGYWRVRLGGEIAPLELPTDRPRPAVLRYRGALRVHRLKPDLAGALRACGRREGATLFMVLLAGIKTLLQRFSGQDDILVGTPVAGRRPVETEGLIGCFLNTLVLRTDLGGEPGFRDLVGRVRETTLGAFAHQDVPFEALLVGRGVERDLSRTPFFQVFLNLLNFPSGELRLPGLRVEVAAIPEPAAKFDLTFYVRGDGEGIRLDLAYNADLFDAPRMAELLLQLEWLLAQAIERPEEPVGRLSLVTPSARVLLPDPEAPLGNSWLGAVHELFAAQARRAPERPAVVDSAGVWSYGELAALSARLAAWLRAQGVAKGDRVAIYAHRSAPLVQAILGTLAAGAVFTLLDPAYPAAQLVERLRLASPAAWVEMVAAGPPPEAVDVWLTAADCPRLALPAGGGAAALADLAEWTGAASGPDDPACVTFTSGSTGAP
ncbi:MAG TPA: condensation domain-containing protein, partial [Thermoanaerobaculia bacterium]|nr:condensation domain-containing protein [Thermoanaerobaculia bacterium]